MDAMKAIAGKLWRAVRAICVLGARVVLDVLAAAAVAAIVALCLRIRIATAVAMAVLPHGEGCENTFTIERLGLGGLEVSNARLGGLPMAPSFDALRVKWSAAGLRGQRIEGITLEGLDMEAAHEVPNFSMPSPGGAGEPPLSKDILRGWRIDSADVRTKRIDLAALMPTNLPARIAIEPSASLEMSARFDGAGYRCAGSGLLAGRPLAITLEYTPGDASGRAALDWTLPEAIPGDRQKLESLSARLDFAFEEAHGVSCRAEGFVGLRPCEWKVPLSVEVSPDAGLTLALTREELHLTEADPLAQDALALAEALAPDMPLKDVAFGADLSWSFTATAGAGAPAWKARGGVSNAEIGCKAGDVQLRVAGGRARGAAEGCGALVSVAPCHVSVGGASIGALEFGRGRATILPEGESLVVSEASIGFCGGDVRLYALYLDMAKLSTGFTVVLDNLLLADFLELFPQLRGSEATGRLYGRIPLRIAGGGVRLGESFIYSPPGETGTVRIANTEFVASFFSQAGLPPAVSGNISKALENLNYDVFRMDLVNPRQEDGRLALRIQGKAPDGKVVTPVNINANINGPIEKFLNLAIKTATIGTQRK